MATAAPEIPVLARDQAFESLYRRYVKDVYHYALALLRNPSDAEDVTQTTFLNAYRAYSRGVEVEKPRNWLIKIAHNVARTRYARASRRAKEVPLEDHVEQLAVPEENRPDVRGVLQALGRLPFNQRAALVMRELEGRNYGEIADTLGVSVSAVETLIFRARRSLRVKTSALRSLAAVPLPSSLAQFFEGGGVLAGSGGVLAGAGFVAKATVAVVAGMIAAGIGSDRGDRATAARPSFAGPSAEQSWSTAPAWVLAAPQRIVKAVDLAVRDARTAGAVAAGPRPRSPAPASLILNGPATAGPLAATTGRAAAAAPLNTVGSQPQTVASTARQAVAAVPEPAVAATAQETVATAAQSVATTAQQAVGAAAAAVPAPIPQVPAVPAVPVDVPKIPGGTPLP